MSLLVNFIRILFDVIGKLIFRLKYWSSTATLLPPISNHLLVEPATSLARKIRANKVTSEDVVQAFIARIHEVNPILNCVVDNRFDSALEEAREVDHFLSLNDYDEEKLAKEKPFLGVPFSIKDSFKVKGLKHTSGLWSRKNIVAEENAEAVQLMIDAGAIILCVTNVPEMCMWWESYNTIYGRSKNPYDVNRTVGGSSGGEGGNLSAAGSPFGIGSDIGGSIRIPSFFNGIFGHKPTTGIVSNDGQEPITVGELNKYNVTGPMSRYACDLAPMFKVLASSNIHQLNLDKEVNMRDIKVYYMEDDGGSALTTPVNEELKQAQMKVIQYFKETYNIDAVKLNLPKIINSLEIYLAMLSIEKEAPSFAQELALKKGEIHVWREFFKCLFGLSKHTMGGLLLCLLEKLKSKDQQPPNIAASIAACEEIKIELMNHLGENGIFLYPTQPNTALYHSQPLFRPFDCIYTAIFNPMGFPVTQCPLGLSSKGLPLGIQVVANLHMDHVSLAVASELEKAFGGWHCPSHIL